MSPKPEVPTVGPTPGPCHDYAAIMLVGKRCERRLRAASGRFAGATGGLLEYEGEMAAKAAALLDAGIEDVARLRKLVARPRLHDCSPTLRNESGRLLQENEELRVALARLVELVTEVRRLKDYGLVDDNMETHVQPARALLARLEGKP